MASRRRKSGRAWSQLTVVVITGLLLNVTKLCPVNCCASLDVRAHVQVEPPHITATRYFWLFCSRSTSDTARDEGGGNIFSLFKMAPSESGSGENN